MTQTPDAFDIQRAASDIAFGQPLIVNYLRGLVAEVIVKAALGLEWRWCSGDWAGWDFEHANGTKLEVKQSAARQSWTQTAKVSSPRFDIAARAGRWDGSTWIAGGDELQRHADVYVFAWHPVTDETADHRAPEQWMFYVVPTVNLPATKSLSLARVKVLADPSSFHDLATTVAGCLIA